MTSLLLVFLLAVGGYAAPRLESYSVDPSSVSVSGFSSGGCFAVQFHVSFSASLCGAGVSAGVPYWCAQLGLEHAMIDCMTVPSLIDVQKLVEATEFAYATGTIDNPSHLSKDRVFLFSGSNDTVVHPGVMRKVQDYYQFFVSAGSMAAMFSIPAEHSMVTDGYGNSCGLLSSPYINNCSYSTAYHLLQHIYQNLTLAKADIHLDANLLEFDQSEFTFPTAGAISMDSIGYVYVPTACKNSSTVCRLHIAFHGCTQGREHLSSLYPLHAGYGTVAEANNIIVLYPQAVSSLYNPKGCWDWWGYTGVDYAVKTAPQMRAVKSMLDRVLGTHTCI